MTWFIIIAVLTAPIWIALIALMVLVPIMALIGAWIHIIKALIAKFGVK